MLRLQRMLLSRLGLDVRSRITGLARLTIVQDRSDFGNRHRPQDEDRTTKISSLRTHECESMTAVTADVTTSLSIQDSWTPYVY